MKVYNGNALKFVHKDARSLVEQAMSQGARLIHDKRGHARLLFGDGIVMIPNRNTSDPRAMKNFKAGFKRYGGNPQMGR